MGSITFPATLNERRLRVDRASIRRYADVTLDYNPIHLDPEFAARTPLGGVIAHGMLSLSLVWQSLQATFGFHAMPGATLDIRFVRPVRENDTVTAGGTQTDDQGRYEVWVRAESGNRSEIVIAGTATIEVQTAA